MNLTNVSPLISVVDTIALILTILIIVRIALSWMNVSHSNPAVQIIIGIVDPILSPFRRILPTFGGIDFSPLLAMLVINVVQKVVDEVLIGAAGRLSIPKIILAIVIDLLRQVDLFICVLVGLRLLLQALQSSPFHPANMFMRQMTDPFIRPFRSMGKGNASVVIAFVFYVILYLVIVNVGNAVLTASF